MNFESHIPLIIEFLFCFVAALFFPRERLGAIGSSIGHALGNLCLGFSVHGGIERLCLGGFSIGQQSLSACDLAFCILQSNFSLLAGQETIADSDTHLVPRVLCLLRTQASLSCMGAAC